MRRIVLFCSAGMSTSALVRKMEQAAEAIDYEVSIDAYSVSDAARLGKDADVILLGPQVRFNLDNVKAQLPDKPVDVIGMRDYGTMNGEAVIAQVKEILGDD